MTDNMTQPTAEIRVETIGHSNETVIIIDNFLSNTDHIIDYASSANFQKPANKNGYPGIQSPIPRYYGEEVVQRCDPIIRKYFMQKTAKLDHVSCNLSLVTLQPHELRPMQKIPHIDTSSANRIAILHYLCHDRFGGTAFFEQKSTGLTTVDQSNFPIYAAAKKQDLANITSSHGYPDQHMPDYERIANFDARFNRILIYRSLSLHSGIIDNPEQLSTDASSGRLTGNIFLDYEEL